MYIPPNKKIDIKELAKELAVLLNGNIVINSSNSVKADNEPDFNTNEQIAKIMVSGKTNKKIKSNLSSKKKIETVENKVDNVSINNIINTIKDIS